MTATTEISESSSWRQLIDYLPDAAVCLNQSSEIVLLNAAAKQLLGYSTEDLGSLSLAQLLWVADSSQPVDVASINALVNTNESIELLVRHKAAGFIPVLLSINSVSETQAAQPYCKLAILKDISGLKKAEAQIDDEKKRFQLLFNNISDSVFLAPISEDGVHGNFVEVNDAACKRLGYSREEFLNMNARTLNPAANLDKVKAFGRHIRREGNTMFEAIHVTKDGTQFPVEVVAKIINIREQEYVLSVVRDLRDHKRLQQTETRFGRLIDHSWEEIYIFDSESLKFLEVNRGALDNLGYSKKEIQELSVTDIKPEIDEAEFRKIAKPLFDGDRSRIIFETVHQRRDGSVYPVEIRLQLSHSEVPPVFLANVQDITERRKSQTRLQYLANFDSLTELPNRSLFLDRLSMAMENSKRAETITALMYLDLDGFKAVNDSLGHVAGDHLLKQVAKRLCRCARKSDTVARLGGDEFTLIVSNLKNVADVEKVAQKIIRTLSAPFIIDGHEVHTSTSLGVTLYPFNDSDDVYAIVKQADTAMYQAKKLGKNNYKFYTAQLWQTELRRIKVENAVKFALERNELSLLYQPRFSLNDNTIVGAEALLRWNHPTLGAVSPVEFIPIVEGQGLIQIVGAWVLQQACEQLHAWLELYPEFRMSINVSARQLENEDFITVFRQTIDRAQINPANLEIEITEGVLIERSQQTVETLRCFKDMGVRISLDDFGAGYSSLNYLKRFAIDILKIDKSFVMDVNENNDSGAIVEAIIGLAKSMRLHVTAEGIETEQQLLFLQQRGCDEGQGYLFAKPMPAPSLKEMLAKQLQKAG